jgi:2'-hydroxyisoflavone reductase
MDLLVLGGTAWLGREVAAQAIAAGHAVTCMARGQAGQFPAGCREVIVDRDRLDAYDRVVDQRWDAVIDVARQPGHVRRAVTALQPVVGVYVYVSSASAYAGQRELGQDEDAPLLAPLDSDVMESMELYGQAKAACEQAVLRGFGADRAVVARVGLIGGPGDESGRSGYWPWRFAHPSNIQGAVLVPDDPQVPTAVIDVRDLAAWLLHCAETGVTGIYNAAGPSRPLAEHLALARTVAGHTGPVRAAPPEWFTDHGVQMWMGPTSLPLWIDDPDWYGMNDHSTARARDAGLTTRPLQDTLTETLVWEESRSNPGPHGAGLTDEEERQLLTLLAADTQ